MSQIWIKNGYVLTMGPSREVYADGDVLIEDGHVKAVGRVAPEAVRPDAEIVDAAGKIVMPGFVNTHVHLLQQLGRGLADDVDLLTWLRGRVWPYESSMTTEDAYVSALACCVELIRSGVTTFAEAGGWDVDAMGQAVAASGLRSVLCRSTMDSGLGLPERWVETTEQCLDRQKELYERWHGQADGRIRYWFGIRTIFNATDELLVRTKALADQYGVGINMHVAEIEDEVQLVKRERGRTTVAHLAHLGVLDRNFLAVHSVWLTDEEVELYRHHQVKVSHNPGAAMKVTLGFAKIPEMLERGICVALGTDGAPSNNHMDIMNDMYLASLIHKGRTLNPKAAPAEQILEMATIQGARALLWDDQIGSLEPGKKADLIILDPMAIGSQPLHDPISGIVYAMTSRNIESSMCGGRWLMKHREVLTIDEQDVLRQVSERAGALLGRTGIVLPERFPVIR